MATYDFSGKTVLITGASGGIGAAFARQLAPTAKALVLVARSGDKLQALAQQLGPHVHAVALDLGKKDASAALVRAVTERGLSIDVLVNNAGYGSSGAFASDDIDKLTGSIDLNVTALVELTHAFLPQIIERKGGVLNVASTVSFGPMPYMAIYGATKAFVLSFSEALAVELAPSGARVSALCPGATETGFFERAGEVNTVGAIATPDDVAALGLRAFARGKTAVVHGWQNKLLALFMGLAPRAFVARMAGRTLAPKAPAATSKSARTLAA